MRELSASLEPSILHVEGSLLVNPSLMDRFNPYSQKLIHYEAKVAAINDVVSIIKSQEEVSDSLKRIRELGKKQFKNIYKQKKLLAHLAVHK